MPKPFLKRLVVLPLSFSKMVDTSITFRSVVDKDLPYLTSWIYGESWGFKNDNLFSLVSEMKHCIRFVAVGTDDLPLSYFGYSIFEPYIYIGAYITDPKYRGHGIGFKLWNWAMDKIGRDKNFYLLSVELTEKYRTISKFHYTSPITFLQYTGFVCEKELGQIIRESTNNESNIKLFSNFDEKSIKNVIDYDFKIRNRNDSEFLKVWLNQNLHNTARTVFAKDQDGHVVGYGSIVMGHTNRKVGPLVADTFSIMLILLQDLIGYDFSNDNNKEKEKILWTLPSSNIVAKEFLEKLKFELDEVLDRLFTEKPDYDDFSEKIYCLARQLGAPN